jgi:hypothetical protein
MRRVEPRQTTAPGRVRQVHAIEPGGSTVRNLDALEVPAADLVTATSLLADLVCELGTCPGRLNEEAHAKALWIANRVRDDMREFFNAVLVEVEANAAVRLAAHRTKAI